MVVMTIIAGKVEEKVGTTTGTETANQTTVVATGGRLMTISMEEDACKINNNNRNSNSSLDSLSNRQV
jgi:hypothetical protein